MEGACASILDPADGISCKGASTVAKTDGAAVGTDANTGTDADAAAAAGASAETGVDAPNAGAVSTAASAAAETGAVAGTNSLDASAETGVDAADAGAVSTAASASAEPGTGADASGHANECASSITCVATDIEVVPAGGDTDKPSV